MPLGSKRSKFNYNLDEKRVLNFENVVNDDDNIKQDMSIDVYGRKTEEDDEPQNGAAEVCDAFNICFSVLLHQRARPGDNRMQRSG